MGSRSRRTGNREEHHLAAQLPGAKKISRSGYGGPDVEGTTTTEQATITTALTTTTLPQGGFEDGVWLVGADIDADVYETATDIGSSGCYWEREGGSSEAARKTPVTMKSQDERCYLITWRTESTGTRSPLRSCVKYDSLCPPW